MDLAVATPTAAEPQPTAEPSRLGRNLAALAGGQLATWTATLGWTLVVPRLLGPAGMGLIISAWSVTGILAIVLGLGTRTYLVRAIVLDRAHLARLVGTATALRLLLSPLFVAAIVLYSRAAAYGAEGSLVLYLAAGATILTLLADPMQAAFQALERMQYLAYADVLNKSAQSALGILLAILGFGAVGIVGCWMVVAGVVVVLNAVWLRRWAPLTLGTTVPELRVMVRESLAYWAFGLFMMIYLWIDAVMLSLMTTPTVVGWYGVPTKLFQTIMFLPMMVGTAWLPRLVVAHEESERRLRQVAEVPVGLVLACAIPLSAGMVVAAGPAVALLYGPQYAQAVPVLALLGLCVTPMYLNILFGQILIAAERQVQWTWVMAGATVINPLFNLVLITVTQDRFGNGAIGAAISLLLTELVIVAAAIRMVGGGVLARNAGRIARVSLASLGMCAVAVAARPAGALPSILIAGASFVVLAIALRVAKPSEVAYVRARLARRHRRTARPDAA